MTTFLQDWLLPWAMFAVSLFNTLLLLWLGLTVLLNAHTRNWGTLLAGSGLLVGAGFFLIHTAALDYSLDRLLETSAAWWFILAAPVVALPWGWMILMLWYCGLWDEGIGAKRWRVVIPFALSSMLGIALVVVAVWSAPKLNASPFAFVDDQNLNQWTGFRVGLWLYPPFLVGCTATALVALKHPAPTGHWSREASRRRAGPYLLASSWVQLAVSLAVATALLFFGIVSRDDAFYNVAGQVAGWLNAVDFALCACIAIAVMLLGKAVVSFEIFTGKVLPRRGFWRQWRAVVLLAALYAGTMACSMGFEMRGIYSTLLATTLLGIFLAVFSHRAYSDHERGVNRLAPFVASGHLLDGLVRGDEAKLRGAVDEPFRALCEDVLNAGRAALVPRAEIAPLFGEPRVYPSSMPFQSAWRELAAQAQGEVCSLAPESGMDYLVPLGRNVPLGALLLGPRRDGGLYTLEEIEIARAAGEHLLDSQAGATLAARLVILQREKVAEVATLDRHARRVLHDDILPLLHAALLNPSDAGAQIMGAHKGISNLLRELPVPSPLENKSFFEALRYEVDEELRGSFDCVTWFVDEAAERFVDEAPGFLAATLFFAAREAVRNAARHGRGKDATRRLNLEIRASVGEMWNLLLIDDGAGRQSTGEAGGSGGGLALHAALLAVAGGQLSLDSGDGTRVELRLPV